MSTASTKHQKVPLWHALALGLAAAAFFSVSFVLNRMMAQAAGHWAWSAALRFLLMLPILAVVISLRRQWGKLWQMWKIAPAAWCLWGMLGCGLFYAPMVAACALSPAWLVAATWPVSIVIGILLGPFLYRDHRRIIPRGALFFSCLIIAGVLLLQSGEMDSTNQHNLVISLILVLISATAHPIGNRRSMLLLESAGFPPDPILRLSLLILGSLPFWLLLCVWGMIEAGPPSPSQWGTVAIIAATGIIATPLFYAASDRASHDPNGLAAVESTQAGEIVFTMLFEAILIGIAPPTPIAWLGIALILTGFLLHARPPKPVTSRPS